MNTVKLSEIAELWTGYAFRESIDIRKNGEFFVLQASDVVAGKIANNLGDFQKIIDKPKNARVLRKNDIIIISRAYPNAPFRSMLYSSSPELVIPTSSVHIISLNTDRVLPEYLLELLNSSKVQRQLHIGTAGTTTASLSKVLLQDIELKIIDLNKQKEYINTVVNIRKHRDLLLKKAKLLESLQNNIINSI